MIRRLATLALAALVPFVQQGIDVRRGRFQAQEEVLYVWSGQHVRRMSPGLENLLADIYWLRTVQYFGGQRAFAHGSNFDLLQPLIDITTTLDPRFELAYRYGAVFLAEPPPTGAGQPRAAIQLLERGVSEIPGSWRIRQDLGFFHFFFLHEPEQAASILLEAADLPGAPFWLRSSAADFLRQGGERDASRQLWQRLFEESDGPMRENALFNLRILDARDAMEAHEQAVAEFTRRTGRAPGQLAELGPAGLLRAPLVDPAGAPFDYDPVSGKLAVARRSPPVEAVPMKPTRPPAEIIVAAVLASVMTMAGTAGAAPSSPEPAPSPTPVVLLSAGETVPSFEATGIDGDVHEVKYKGTTIVLFFLSSCPVCHKMIPEWNKAYERRPPGVEVVGVVLDQEPPGFFAVTPVSFPVVHAPSREFSRIYKVNRVPITLRVAAGGKVDDIALGIQDPIRLGELFRR